MEIILSAIAAGGLVGAADQYLCLLLLSIGARLGLFQVAPEMSFLTSYWFMGAAAVLWVLTNSPAYASLLAPGVMNAINAAVNFISGFVVPLSAGLFALAAAGVITGLNPDLDAVLQALRVFNQDGSLGTSGAAIAGAGALAAVSLTGMKGLAKPAVSAATQTTGTLSAPVFATLESLASVLIVGLIYFLSKINPWLLVALLVIVFLLMAVLLAYALYQLWKLQKGIGRLLRLAQAHPLAGLSIALEFLVWGGGWLAWKSWGRGLLMLAAWGLWILAFIFIDTLVAALFAFFPPLIPVMVTLSSVLLIALYVGISLKTTGSLMKHVEPQVAGQGAAGSSLRGAVAQ
jgi:hypothetical protein